MNKFFIITYAKNNKQFKTYLKKSKNSVLISYEDIQASNQKYTVFQEEQSDKVLETDVYLDEMLEADEVFCTGTAVTIAPVGKIKYQNRVCEFSSGSIGPIAKKCKEALTSIRRQEIKDPFGWLHIINKNKKI